MQVEQAGLHHLFNCVISLIVASEQAHGLDSLNHKLIGGGECLHRAWPVQYA